MPNRLLKESITTSEDINGLSAGAEILFYRLIVKADDYGIYYGNAHIVKSACFPLREEDIKAAQVTEWIKELINAGLIQKYTGTDGRDYLRFTTWNKHQQIRSKRSKFPPPADDCRQMKSDDIKCNQMQSNVPVIQSNPIQSETESESVNESNPITRENTQPKKPMTEEERKERVDHFLKMYLHYKELKRDTKGVLALAEIEGISYDDLNAAYKADK